MKSQTKSTLISLFPPFLMTYAGGNLIMANGQVTKYKQFSQMPLKEIIYIIFLWKLIGVLLNHRKLGVWQSLHQIKQPFWPTSIMPVLKLIAGFFRKDAPALTLTIS